MMKRITALGVLIVMTLSFSGCGVKYNAVVVDSGLTFREEFLQENKINHVIFYPLDDEGNLMYDDEGGLIAEWINDDTLPRSRTFIIEDLDEFYVTFTDSSKINFEKEMVLIYIFSTVNANRIYKIEKIKLDGKKITVYYKVQGGNSNYADAGRPQREFLIIKLDKLDITTVEFIRK